MSEKKETGGAEVVVTISAESKEANANTKGSSPMDSETSAPRRSGQGVTEAKTQPHCPSPEIAGFTGSPHKPPKIPTSEALARRRSVAKSVYSRSKSRFGDPPVDINYFENNNGILQEQIGGSSSYRSYRASPGSKPGSRAVSINQRTPLMASPGGVEDDDEEIYKRVNSTEWNKKKHRRVKVKVLVEWIAFLVILGFLVASLTIDKLEKTMIWGLELWKWCVLVMVIFSGMLVTKWIMNFIVFLIERNFLLKKKVLYFVHGLKKSVQVFIWLALILVTWVLLFDRGVKRSYTTTKILNSVTWTLVTLLIGSFFWLLKNLLLKILASAFNVTTFFDRIQVSVFHQYVLQTLSGPPLMESAQMVGREPSAGRLSFRSIKKGKKSKEKKLIDMGEIHRMKREKVSASVMKELIDVILSSGLPTISDTLESIAKEGERADKEITNEMEAIAAAYHIFRNVCQPGFSYIEEEDLLRFMIKEEVDHVLPLFEGMENGRIERRVLTNWVVKAYNDRKALAHALNDTKTAVKQLNKVVTGVVIVVVLVVWLLLMEIATTKVLVLLSSQLVVAAFMFGNTCKTIFEAIIFVFVMHPFDVGDRCLVDGVQLIVDEMNILTTVFLKIDREKVYYPNSVLATKPISNFYRSSPMGDNVEFSIAFATTAEKIGALKERIAKYLERNPQYWFPAHTLVVKEIENVNKIKMTLFVNHTINFQDYPEKTNRRTELVLELKKIFEDLDITYYLLPQEIQISNTTTPATIHGHATKHL